MSIELQRMLNEFIDRTFTVRDMARVINSLHYIVMDKAILEKCYKKNKQNLIPNYKRAIEEDEQYSKEILDEYGLDYDLDELLKYQK